MVDRERGAAAHECPNCGTVRDAVAQPDGSVAVEACPKCYPPAGEGQKPSQAPQEPAKVEQAGLAASPIISREQGTSETALETDEGVN